MNENSPQPPSGPDDASNDAGHVRTALIERLFREHNEALIRFLMLRTRSYQEAREAAQEAYVRLLNLDAPGAVSYLRAFLFKTAANIVTDRRRRDEAETRMVAEPLFQEFVDVRTPERQLIGEQTLHRMQRLIAAMPPKCQQAFVLNQFYDVGFAAIAKEMSISERMVRKYVVRALAHCRARLDLEVME